MVVSIKKWEPTSFAVNVPTGVVGVPGRETVPVITTECKPCLVVNGAIRLNALSRLAIAAVSRDVVIIAIV